MIVGIGIDICQISRIESCKDSFNNKYFTTSEMTYSKSKKESLAAIFAAKEAFAKMLGTGFTSFDLQAIEIVHNEMGAPEYKLSSWAYDEVIKRKIDNIYLTISHDGGIAIAVAIGESKDVIK